MKTFNFQGVNFNLSSGFSVSIDDTGAMSIVKDVPEVAVSVAMNRTERYESNSIIGLKWGDVTKQCRKLLTAGIGESFTINSHKENTIRAALFKLGISASILEVAAYEYLVEITQRTDPATTVSSQCAKFTGFGQTLAIHAMTSHAITVALHSRDIGANIEKTPHKEWFVVTTRPLARMAKRA